MKSDAGIYQASIVLNQKSGWLIMAISSDNINDYDEFKRVVDLIASNSYKS
ncbi:hypothetical protein LJB88_03000 [Erysipelotrichaceae bacterium OttesenSCG-928-M19]|nr:hypothetical protein [Erysipelotrichaceae bacterium OttesenSCG-928-M19]